MKDSGICIFFLKKILLPFYKNKTNLIVWKNLVSQTQHGKSNTYFLGWHIL